LKKVHFSLNIPARFGIIKIAIEMAGISRRTASRKLQRSKDFGPASLGFQHYYFGNYDLFRA
jgi:hypothetical protein